MFTLDPEQTPSCQIVIPDEPTAVEERAAEVLREYLRRIIGLELQVVGDAAPACDGEIILGASRRLRKLAIDIDFAELQTDGFALRTVGGKLIIAGGSEKGTLYGVYEFLERYLSCRRYSPEVEFVPQLQRIELSSIEDTQIPQIDFRQDFYRLAEDPGYAEWHRLDNHKQDWGMWVHTFATLLSPQEYFGDHPEYFSLVNGERISDGQLCLTNETVFSIVIASLGREMAKKPRAHYWSVSTNDTFKNCECDACRALDEREESPMGSLLTFVNRVAAEFPEKTISTLAYQYSRKPPKKLRPAANVNIVLCNIECNRSRPIATDPGSASFRADVEGWAKICDNILIWDYVIQFANLVSPFPNLRVLQPNIRYFVDNHSVAMFQQGNREVGGEFAELRAYLIAKLLWNPDADVDALMHDFLDGYYGAGGRFIHQYIDRLHDELEKSGLGLGIFGHPTDPADSYLAPELIREYEELFQGAEDAVRDSPDLLERVHQTRLPLYYASLQQARKKGTEEGGLFSLQNGEYRPRPELVERLEIFVDGCNRQGVTRVTEWRTTPDEYREDYFKLSEP